MNEQLPEPTRQFLVKLVSSGGKVLCAYHGVELEPPDFKCSICEAKRERKRTGEWCKVCGKELEIEWVVVEKVPRCKWCGSPITYEG
jgi:predicted amidophosphoribosyltransferase